MCAPRRSLALGSLCFVILMCAYRRAPRKFTPHVSARTGARVPQRVPCTACADAGGTRIMWSRRLGPQCKHCCECTNIVGVCTPLRAADSLQAADYELRRTGITHTQHQRRQRQPNGQRNESMTDARSLQVYSSHYWGFAPAMFVLLYVRSCGCTCTPLVTQIKPYNKYLQVQPGALQDETRNTPGIQ